jgi:hypothetical protein
LNLVQVMAFEQLTMTFERMAFDRLTTSGEMPLCLPSASACLALLPPSAHRP